MRGTWGPLRREEGAAVKCSKSENGCESSWAGSRRPLNDPDIAGLPVGLPECDVIFSMTVLERGKSAQRLFYTVSRMSKIAQSHNLWRLHPHLSDQSALGQLHNYWRQVFDVSVQSWNKTSGHRVESRLATGPTKFRLQKLGMKTFITFSVKIVWSIQVVKEFKKNVTTELNTIPLGVFDDCFVQLKKDAKGVLQSGKIFWRKV